MTHNAKLIRRRFGRTGIIIALTAVLVLVAGGILLLVLT
jgi:hypothetical protein